MKEPAARRPSASTDVAGGILHLLAEIGALVALLGLLGAIAWLVVTVI